MRFGYISLLADTEIVTKFTEELENNRFMGTRCKKCGVKHLPPRAHCTCGSKEMEWYEAPKQGKLLTYTIVAFPPESMTKHAPYTVAIAKLNDGSRLLGHLTDITQTNLKLDMQVQVVLRRISADRITYEFKPL
jgi:uncharacterized OB-fold protein